MSDAVTPSPAAPQGVTPPPPGTPAIPVAASSDNPGTMSPPPQAGQPQPGTPQQPGTPAWGQAGYGAPPPPPAPRQPNPFVENLKADLIGNFPAPNDSPHGKLWAVLSYLPGVFLPLWLVPLVRRNNHLSLFHAKQMLGFAAIQIPTSAAFLLLNTFIAKIPKAGGILSMIASGMLGAAFLVIAVIGLLGALKGQVKPLPLIGRTVDRMTRGLTVVPPAHNPEPQLDYWLRVAPVARPGQPAQQSQPMPQQPAPQQQWQAPAPQQQAAQPPSPPGPGPTPTP